MLQSRTHVFQLTLWNSSRESILSMAVAVHRGILQYSIDLAESLNTVKREPHWLTEEMWCLWTKGSLMPPCFRVPFCTPLSFTPSKYSEANTLVRSASIVSFVLLSAVLNTSNCSWIKRIWWVNPLQCQSLRGKDQWSCALLSFKASRGTGVRVNLERTGARSGFTWIPESILAFSSRC